MNEQAPEIDIKFEEEKKRTEQENNKEKRKFLASEFSLRVKENPIEIYVKYDNFPVDKKLDSFNSINSVDYDKSGTSGSSALEFSDREYISIKPNSFSGSTYFNKNSGVYKISNESFHLILDMMNKTIDESGYSNQDKEKMKQMVIDNLKDKIISDGDIKNFKN